MKTIVSVDRNWGIGYNGNLLLRIPEDMKFFKKMTVGKVVVMGRETFESLPGQQPLKDRTNIILSSGITLKDDKAIICRTSGLLLQELKKYPSEDICIIGGETVFNLMLPYCREAYVTKIDKTFPADRFLKNLDKSEEWDLSSRSDWQIYQDIPFCYVKYECQTYQELK